jgi:hypothetical protein
VARLDHLEKQANQLRMPIAYESMMYLLRNHIGIVRNPYGQKIKTVEKTVSCPFPA